MAFFKLSDRIINKDSKPWGYADARVGAIAWQPDEITNLVLWLDAADLDTLTLDGSNNVEQWNDKSGEGNHVSQSDSSRCPSLVDFFNSQKSVSFNGHCLNASLDTSAVATLFFVIRINTINQEEYRGFFSSCLSEVDKPSNTFQFDIGGPLRGGENKIGIFGNDSSNNPSTRAVAPNNYTAGEKYIVLLSAKTNSLGISVNSSSFDTVPLTDFNPAYKTIGIGRNRGNNEFINGDIAECGMYFNEISVDSRQKVEGYLAHKWGLTANLPADHLYKDSAP